MDIIYSLLLITLVLISIPHVHSKWGFGCPNECNCTEVTLASVAAAKWIFNNPNPSPTKSHRQKDFSVRSVSCTIQSDTNNVQLFRKLPEDVQVLILNYGDFAKLFTLSDKYLRQFSGLISLEIRGNNRQELKRITVSSDLLRTQRKLQYLHLRNINVSTVDATIFNKLTGLKVLHLVDVGLKSVPPRLFYGLSSLEEICLDNNELEEVDGDAFSTLYNLKTLSISNNRLKCYNNCTGDRPLDRLQFLDLSSNEISQMSSLTFLPMPSLTTLQLENNPIQVIFPYAFQATGRVQRLTLGHSRQYLHVLPFSFAGLSDLISLTLPNMDNNVLEHGIFAGLTSLRRVDVNGKIQQVTENAFFGAPNLEIISLRDCRLRRIFRDAFASLKHLEVLDLSHNRLGKINPSAFYGLRRLRELQLQFNQLETLPRRLYTVLPPAIKSIRLEGNPWNCTCDIGKMKFAAVGRVRKDPNNIEFATSEVKYVRDKRLMPLCHFPTEFHGKPVVEVLKKQLKCYKKKSL